MDGESECEFPGFNQMEEDIGEEVGNEGDEWSEGGSGWSPSATYAGGHFGGVVLQTSPSASHILGIMFPRVQVQLRRNTIRRY